MRAGQAVKVGPKTSTFPLLGMEPNSGAPIAMLQSNSVYMVLAILAPQEHPKRSTMATFGLIMSAKAQSRGADEPNSATEEVNTGHLWLQLDSRTRRILGTICYGDHLHYLQGDKVIEIEVWFARTVILPGQLSSTNFQDLDGIGINSSEPMLIYGETFHPSKGNSC